METPLGGFGNDSPIIHIDNYYQPDKYIFF